MALLLQAGMALGLTIPALAQAVLSPNAGAISDFAVAGVTIQRNGDMAALNREQALADGQGIALQLLLRRLLPPEIDSDRVMPRAAEIAGLVEGYDIEQENSAASRYTALVTYRFRPAAIRALVQSAMQGRSASSTEFANPIRARIFLSGLEEWIEVRKRLAAIPALLSTATLGLNRTEAVVELTVAGSIDQVTAALARRDLALEAIEDGYVIHVQGLPVATQAAEPPAAMPAQTETPPSASDMPPPRLFAPRPDSPSQPRP